MTDSTMARERMWDTVASQLGFVTAAQADDLDVSRGALQMLVRRGTLNRVAHGVYRFPKYPVSQYDPYMLAVLWTRALEACLSHETALDAYGICDVNPNRIHVTIGKQRRLRRAGGENYVIHYEDLTARQIGWWQEIPTVTAPTAIAQCIAGGVPTHLLRQAIERGHAQGYLTAQQRDEFADELEAQRTGTLQNLEVATRSSGDVDASRLPHAD